MDHLEILARIVRTRIDEMSNWGCPSEDFMNGRKAALDDILKDINLLRLKVPEDPQNLGGCLSSEDD